MGLLAAAGCGGEVRSETPAVPLYDNLGAFSVPISSRNPRAQQYFDQGMRLTYAFNHAEAIRSFQEALRLDPDCAICHWGVALGYGPNINWPMDSASGVLAWQAIQNAKRLSSKANAREQALIAALATRYAEVPPANRAGLDSAYATAMGDVADQYPDDLEAATLRAEALMDLRPWSYWEADGSPAPQTDLIVRSLERVIAVDSTHPGACHFYIHAVEAVAPERAVACAERLAELMPGAGHLVHMPAHIYIRVGRYADAIERNVHATHADSVFVAGERPSLVYAGLYIPHNHHFLGFAAMLAGRSQVALSSGRETVAKAPVEAMRQMPDFQPMLAFEHSLLLKFGRWDELLALPLPATDVPVARATALYARGTALAATGKGAEATGLVDSVAALGSALPQGIAKSIVSIAQHSLAGELAARAKRWGEAETHFRAAARIEDGLMYMEPPWWIEPVRHALGATLLRAGKAREAEVVYREDIKRFPGNGWALYGLWQSLKAQGSKDAAAAEAEFRKAWAGADVELTTARF